MPDENSENSDSNSEQGRMGEENDWGNAAPLSRERRETVVHALHHAVE
jgi:hypothetical protein